MKKQVLTICHDVVRDQRHNSQSKCLLSSSIMKIFFIQLLSSDMFKDMKFMEAIEYGLSNLISSLWKKDSGEKQWKAIYPTNTCLFTLYADTIWAHAWSRSFGELGLDLSKNRAVPAVCVMHQSIPGVPIPPGQPRGICSHCQSWGWGICNFIAARGLGICAPRGDPRAFDTHVFESAMDGICPLSLSPPRHISTAYASPPRGICPFIYKKCRGLAGGGMGTAGIDWRIIVALLVDLMNDQVSSLQRKGIAANLHRPFHQLYRVESSHQSMQDFWE